MSNGTSFLSSFFDFLSDVKSASISLEDANVVVKIVLSEDGEVDDE